MSLWDTAGTIYDESPRKLALCTAPLLDSMAYIDYNKGGPILVRLPPPLNDPLTNESAIISKRGGYSPMPPYIRHWLDWLQGCVSAPCGGFWRPRDDLQLFELLPNLQTKVLCWERIVFIALELTYRTTIRNISNWKKKKSHWLLSIHFKEQV